MKIIAKFFAKTVRALMTAYVYAAFKPKVRFCDKKRKNTRFSEPVIFVGNHTSHKDGIMTSVVFAKAKGNIVVAKDWYEKKKFNWFLRNNRCIPMDRVGTSTGWLKYSKEALKKGESVILYPEGKTGKGEEPQEFKSGFVMLAIMSGAKVVPYATVGEYKFFGRQKVLIGDPVSLSSENKALSPAYLEKESERFRQMVIDLLKEIRGEKK